MNTASDWGRGTGRGQRLRWRGRWRFTGRGLGSIHRRSTQLYHLCDARCSVRRVLRPHSIRQPSGELHGSAGDDRQGPEQAAPAARFAGYKPVRGVAPGFAMWSRRRRTVCIPGRAPTARRWSFQRSNRFQCCTGSPTVTPKLVTTFLRLPWKRRFATACVFRSTSAAPVRINAGADHPIV